MDHYLLAKALHVIGFVCWFAGLFYVVRLFIYQVEASEQEGEGYRMVEAQLKIMTRRLWFGITWPSLIATVGFGTWLLIQYGLFSLPWVHIKLTLVGILVIYHFFTHRIYRQLNAGTCQWTSKSLRLWNEVATLLLVAIVFVAVFKQGMDAVWGTVGFFGFAALLMIGIKTYGKIRKGR
ncbi:MAG: CopD family protein [Kofleriaceae bacterium]|nr:CopD family protein [Kofleriaceae bacterium]